MPVKKTATKKPATKATKKPAAKSVSSAKVVEVKKPTVVVETKKTDRCECGNECNCGWSCNCGCCMKIIILILVVLNLVVALYAFFQKNPRDLTVSNLGWITNEKKVVNDLYGDENYIQMQTEQIKSSASQYWLD